MNRIVTVALLVSALTLGAVITVAVLTYDPSAAEALRPCFAGPRSDVLMCSEYPSWRHASVASAHSWR
jgi:hypothetical protein